MQMFGPRCLPAHLGSDRDAGQLKPHSATTLIRMAPQFMPDGAVYACTNERGLYIGLVRFRPFHSLLVSMIVILRLWNSWLVPHIQNRMLEKISRQLFDLFGLILARERRRQPNVVEEGGGGVGVVVGEAA